MKETSLIVNTAIFVVLASIMLIAFSIFSFVSSQDETLKNVLAKSRLDALELIETNQKLSAKAISTAMWHKTSVMSKVIADTLKEKSFESAKSIALHFFDRPEMEIVNLQMTKNGSVEQMVISKLDETLSISNEPLNEGNLLHLLKESSEATIDDGSKIRVTIYFSDETLIQASYNAVSDATKKALEFEKTIRDRFDTSSIYQEIIHISIALILMLTVSFSLFTLNKKIVATNNNLRNANKKLEENFEKLEIAHSDLQSTQSQLIESEKMAALGNLVAGIAHEIKTPIGVCVTAASTIKNRSDKFLKKREGGTIDESDYDKFIKMSMEGNEIIVTNLHRASELINSFKQVAVDQTSMAVREFNLKSYLLEIITSLKPQLKNNKHEIKVECDDGILINGYPGAIYQIFVNLITNSIVHGFRETKSGTITISAKQIGDMVNIIYKDNGTGIPKENLKKIFEPFFTTNRSHGGSGLGMHILFNLITHKLGGSITAHESSEGAMFKISFPIKQA